MARRRSRKHGRKQRGKGGTDGGLPVDPGGLLAAGWERLAAGDARGAIDRFRALQKVDEASAWLPLFCACRLRARALRARGLGRDAAAMEKNAASYRERLEPSALRGGEWSWFLRASDPAAAVRAFAARVAAEGAAEQLEAAQVVADHLVVGRCWEALADLEAQHPLRQDAERVRAALPEMDAGDWAAAGEGLAGVARRSPYAPWRWFCKAMICHAAGDEAGLARALAGVPETFALRDTVAALRASVAGQEPALRQPAARETSASTRPAARREEGSRREASRGPATAEGVAALLGQGAGEGQVQALLTALRGGEARRVEDAVRGLAAQILPDDVTLVYVALFEIAAAGARPLAMPDGSARAFDRLLPKKGAMVAAALRVVMLGLEASGRLPVEMAGQYFQVLNAEFPDPRQRALAWSRVLMFVAQMARAFGVRVWQLPPWERETLEELVPDESYHGPLALAGLAHSALELDPEDRAGHDVWLALLQLAGAKREIVEDMLETMARRFPDDPTPWLELGRVHLQRRNAYRKAQAALAEARRRAPHDSRLLDLEAVARLRAVVQGRRRGAFAKAQQDLEAAAQMQRPELAPLVQAERMALQLCAPDEGGVGAVRDALAPLTRPERVRAVAVLVFVLQATMRGRADGERVVLAAEGLLAEHAADLEALAPEAVAGVCAPLPEVAAPAYEGLSVASALRPWWQELLVRAAPRDLVAVADAVLGAGGVETVLAVLDRRLLGKEQGEPLWRFYRLVLQEITGQGRGAAELEALREELDDAGRTRLEAAARRLAAPCRLHDPYDPVHEALARGDLEALAEALEGPDDLPDFNLELPQQGDLFPELPRQGPPKPRRRPPGLPGPTLEAELGALSPAELLELARHTAAATGAPLGIVAELLAPKIGLTAGALLELFDSLGDDPLGDGDDDGDNEWGQEIEDPVASAEELIEEAELRGKPLHLVREAAAHMRRDPEMTEVLEELAEACGDRRQELSPEAEAVLFPRRKGTAKRPATAKERKRKRQRRKKRR